MINGVIKEIEETGEVTIAQSPPKKSILYLVIIKL